MKGRAAKYFKYGSLFLILFLLVTGISAEYTSRSSFCNSCHHMEPFYEAWRLSSHNNVDCITCHYPPTWSAKIEGKFRGLIQLVNYVGQTYKRSKPWAEIPDTSCLQADCHETRVLSGKVAFQKIVFDHEHHLGDLKRGKQLRCTSCHSQIVQGDHMNVTESSCFLCHFKEKTVQELQASCTICHDWEHVIDNGEMGVYSYDHTEIHQSGKDCNLCHTNVVMGDGAVPIENCYQCHFERDRLNKIDDTDLMHTTHIAEHKIECLQCHLAIQHKVLQPSMATGIPDCVTCHSDMHTSQLSLFTGSGGIDAPHTPNPMYEIGLNCKGCHIFHEGNGTPGTFMGETDVARYESCEQCHGTGYNRILKNWEEVTDHHLKQIKSIFATINSALPDTKLTPQQKIEINKLLNDAHFNFQIVETGKNVHNITYSNKLLSAAYGKLADAAKIEHIEIEKLDFIEHANVIPSECSTCHFGIEEKETSIYSLLFKHEVHVANNGMKCNVCHSNTVTHGQLIMTREGCAQCHHGNESVDCQHCHTLQQSIIAGSPLFYDREIESVMALLGEDCLSCHEIEERHVNRPVGETCVGCHEEGYDEILIDWETDARRQIADLEKILDGYIAQPAVHDVTRLQEMKSWITQTKLDGSNSVHNRALFEDIVERIQDYINQVM